jgi:hypothetical protein
MYKVTLNIFKLPIEIGDYGFNTFPQSLQEIVRMVCHFNCWIPSSFPITAHNKAFYGRLSGTTQQKLKKNRKL